MGVLTWWLSNQSSANAIPGSHQKRHNILKVGSPRIPCLFACLGLFVVNHGGGYLRTVVSLLVCSWFPLGFFLVSSWFSLGSRFSVLGLVLSGFPGSLWFPGFLLVVLGHVFLGSVDLGPVLLGLVVLGHVFLGPVFLGPVFLGPVVVPAW